MDKENNSQWIINRVACNLNALFQKLSEIVKENVEVANSLEDVDRSHYSFTFQKFQDRSHPTFMVQRHRDAGGHLPINGLSVAFAKTPEGILVGCPRHPDYPSEEFVAVPVWDMKEQACFLYVNGEKEKKYQLKEISELALWYLFFNKIRNDQ